MAFEDREALTGMSRRGFSEPTFGLGRGLGRGIGLPGAEPVPRRPPAAQFDQFAPQQPMRAQPPFLSRLANPAFAPNFTPQPIQGRPLPGGNTVPGPMPDVRGTNVTRGIGPGIAAPAAFAPAFRPQLTPAAGGGGFGAPNIAALRGLGGGIGGGMRNLADLYNNPNIARTRPVGGLGGGLGF